MLYHSHPPALPLRGFVECLSLYSDMPTHRKEPILPSGTDEPVQTLAESAFENLLASGLELKFSYLANTNPLQGLADQFQQLMSPRGVGVCLWHNRPSTKYPTIGSEW
jgi:hypothetical protein